MTIEELFAGFGSFLGLPELRLEENGSGSLVFDDHFEVTYTHDAEDESLLISAPLFSATTSRAPMLRHALETGYLGARTRGGTISIDPEREIYVYWKRHDLKAFVSVEDLADATHRFLAEVTRIHETERSLREEGVAPGNASAATKARLDEEGSPTKALRKDLPPDAWLLYV